MKIKNMRLGRTRAAHPAGSAGVVVEGGCAARDAVSTTNPINESSQKIVDLIGVIGVINGIASQASLLALNAAAETARAGERGERFAALAAEVRSLTQRSTAAVTEIKTLMGRPAERTGMRMTEVVASIKRVSGNL